MWPLEIWVIFFGRFFTTRSGSPIFALNWPLNGFLTMFAALPRRTSGIVFKRCLTSFLNLAMSLIGPFDSVSKRCKIRLGAWISIRRCEINRGTVRVWTRSDSANHRVQCTCHLNSARQPAEHQQRAAFKTVDFVAHKQLRSISIFLFTRQAQHFVCKAEDEQTPIHWSV